MLKQLCFFFAVLISSAASQLILHGTYRDFLPAACLHQRDVEGETAVDDAWSNDGSLRLVGDRRCDLLLENPLWRSFIDTQQISGHPDFEAAGFFSNQEACSVPDPATGLFFPVGTCEFEFNDDGLGFKHSIVGRQLLVGENGIPKPQYCDDSEGDETRCGDTSEGQTQTQKKFFDTWYNDDEVFNKRIGLRLQLNQVGVQNEFRFDSDSDPSAVDFPEDSISGFFGPLNMFQIDGSREISFDIGVKDAPAWPQQDIELFQEGAFGFTSEFHTTFEYRSDSQMTLEFDGDDDLWVFINGKLILDIGGVHPRRARSVDLNEVANGISVAEVLNLEDGNVYTLDMFHAERQTVGSNFQLTTTLVPACNIAQSGTASIDFESVIAPTPEEKFLASGMITNSDNNIIVQTTQDTFTSGLFFSKDTFPVLGGFDATFLTTVSADNTIGFAFVLTSAEVDSLPVGSEESFNFEGLEKSVAIVFDLCVDRGANDCKEQQISLHHADDSSEGNSPGDDTKRVNERIFRNLKRNEAFPVQVIYFGGKPDFLEVYLNNSLYIRQDNFKQTLHNLELKDAHVGFTASSGEFAADIIVEDFVFRTVEVDASLTIFESTSIDEPQQITADGEDVSEGIRIVTFDLCGSELETGNLAASVTGFFIEQPNDVDDYFSGETAEVEAATVTDNGDGTYQISLSTLIVANFSLVVAFGDGCEIEFDDNAVPSLNADDGASCFFQQFDDGNVVVETIEATDSPTSSPTGTPTTQPSSSPTKSPSTTSPSASPTTTPTVSPTSGPTVSPTLDPTSSPTRAPTNAIVPTSSDENEESVDLVFLLGGLLGLFIFTTIFLAALFLRQKKSSLVPLDEVNAKLAANI